MTGRLPSLRAVRDDDPPAGVHPLVAAAFAELDAADVRWALLRGSDELADPVGDVDVLVHPDDLGRVDAALARAGLRRMGVVGHGSHRFYLRWDAATRRWLVLDVVSRVDFGRCQEFRSPLAEGYLERRRRTPAGWRLADEDEHWFLLLHLLLDKRRLAPARRPAARIAAGAARPGDPAAVFLGSLGAEQ